MSASIRRGLVLFSAAASVLLAGCVNALSDISIAYPLLIGVLATLSVYHYSGARRKYRLPLIWALFFVFGYVLAFAVGLLDRGSAYVGILQDAGMSEFDNETFFPIFAVMTAGIAGLFLATFVCERFMTRARLPDPQAGELPRSYHRKLAVFSLVCVLGSILAIGVMWVLGMGRTGLPHATTLPFKLTGILVYMKNVVIPMLGFLVFIAAERTADVRKLRIALGSQLLIAVVGGMAFLSRGFFVFMVIPSLAYLAFYGTNRRVARRVALEGGIAIVFAMVIVMPLIVLLRGALYSGIAVESIGSLDYSDAPTIIESFWNIILLMTGRIMGFNELAAVSKLGSFDLSGPWNVFVGNSDYVDGLVYLLFGFSQDPTAEAAFGVSFGLWGMLFLSGSYWVVLGGTMGAAMMIMGVEELFNRKGMRAVAFLMAIIVGTWVWGSIDWFLLSRLLVAVGACYLLVGHTRMARFMLERGSAAIKPCSHGRIR